MGKVSKSTNQKSPSSVPTNEERSEQWKKYYWRDVEATRKRRNAAYRKRRAEVNAQAAAWRSKNPDKVKEADRAYYERNADKIIETKLKWQAANPDRTRAYQRNRRAKICGAPGKVSRDFEKRLHALQRGKCAACRCALEKTGSHLDHVTPLSKGGEHEEKNLQLLCPTCNLRKNSLDPIAFMQRNGFLL